MNTRTEGILRRPIGRLLIFVLAVRAVLYAVAAVLLTTAAAMAQNQMTITATNIKNLKGEKLAAGQACLTPTDNQGSPINFQMPGGGQGTSNEACESVQNGAFSILVPNVALTNRTNVCLKLKVRDPKRDEVLLSKGYECLQPQPAAYWCSGSACNLDNYIPTGTSNVQVIAGPPGSPGGTSAGNAGDVQINNGTGGLGAVPQSTFVKMTGNETVAGTKSFTVSPEVPTTPAGAGSAVAKAYVDGQLAGLATVAATGDYNDLVNKPTSGPTANLSSPGPIGSTQPGPVNATSYSVNGVLISSTNLSDSTNLAKTNVSNTFTQPQKMTDSVTNKTPMADIRAYGAVCDWNGSTGTDNGPALQAAITALGTAGGKIFAPDNCYIANPTTLNWGTVYRIRNLTIQGNLILGSTFRIPDYVDIEGEGGGTIPQFYGFGSAGSIQGLTTVGTLGTSCTANTPCTFTPSSMNHLFTNTAITVAGTTSCTVTSVTRTSNQAVATLSGSCRIPPGASVTVSGVTDTSFNGTYGVSASDYGLNTVTYYNTGSNGSSSGGTMVGLNEDTVETAWITATAGSTATATFIHNHNSADSFGVVVLASVTGSYGHKGLKNITVDGCGGACIWYSNTFYWGMEKVGAQANPYITSIPLVLATASAGTIKDSHFLVYKSPTTPSLPWAALMTEYNSTVTGQGNANGNNTFEGNTFMGGVKIDSAGITMAFSAHGIKFVRNLFERPPGLGVRMDVRTITTPGIIEMASSAVQDNLDNYTNPLCFIGYTDPSGPKGGAIISSSSNLGTGCYANKYFNGPLDFQGALDGAYLPKIPGGVTLKGGAINDMELRGQNAGFEPAVVPAATLNVPDPTTWTTGACTVTQGVAGPDGQNTAVGLSWNTGGSMAVAYFSLTTTPGDWFIFGARVKPGADNPSLAVGADGTPFALRSYSGADVFENSQTAYMAYPQQTALVGDSWNPVIAVARLSAADGANHTYQLQVSCPAAGQGSLQIYDPFVMPLPASTPIEEVYRIRQQMMHSFVPANMPAGGGLLAMNPNHKLGWGNDTYLRRKSAGVIGSDSDIDLDTGKQFKINGDTNLFRASAGIIKTDGSFDVGVGYKCQGSYGSSGQILSTTGSGCSWINPPATSPLTTKGDLYGYSTANARVPVGTDGQCLVADSTQTLGLKWAACGGITGTGTTGYVATWASSSSLGATSHIDDGITTANTVTVDEPFQVNDGALTRIDMTKQAWGTPNAKGAYSGATAYVANDAVTSSGVHYIAIASTTGNAPPNVTYWSVLLPSGYDASTYIGGDGAQHCYLGSTQGSCAPSGLKCSAAAQGALDDGTTDNVAILTAAQSTCTGGIIFTQVLGSGYKVASNFTFTVPVIMDGGKFVVPNAATLTINGGFSAPMAQVFSTSGTGAVKFGGATPKVYAEWWGAKGDWNGSTGTDDHLALQAGIDSLPGGSKLHLLNKWYLIGSSTLTIGTSHPDSIGIVGVDAGFAQNPSGFVSNAATNTIVAVTGTSVGSPRKGVLLKNFFNYRSVTPTSAVKGVALTNTFDTELDHVEADNSLCNFYYNQALNTRTFHSVASNAVGTNPAGYCVDTTSGPSYSSYWIDDFVVDTNHTLGMKGFHVYGNAINDLFFIHPETATVAYGMYFDVTSAATFGAGDIHITDPITDSCYTAGLYFNNLSAAPKGLHVDIKGGWVGCPSAAHQIQIVGSTGISIVGTHIYSGSAGDLVNISGGGGNSVSDIHGSTEGLGIVLSSSTTHNTINGNTIEGSVSTGTPASLISLASSTRNGITGNTLYCTTNTCTAGITADSSSNNNVVGNNSIDTAKITTAFSNSGTGNGPGSTY